MRPSATPTETTPKHARWILLLVLVLGALLRLPALDSVPPPLNQDEASRGYDAWAILETGGDRHGQAWPLFLESFGAGDFTAALTTYLTVPFVAALGPTVSAMRLPDALLGVLTAALLYLWLRRQIGTRTGLLAAAVLATDPWHLALTRTAHESGFTPFFLVAAMLALNRAGLLPSGGSCGTAVPAVKPDDRLPSELPVQKTRPTRPWHLGRPPANVSGSDPHPAWAFLAGSMLAAHAWAYPATRLFSPLFCIALVVVYRRHFWNMIQTKSTRATIAAAAAGLLFGGLPLIVTAWTHPERLAARAGVTLLIHQELGAIEGVRHFLHNLAANLDPRYLFLRCDEMSGASIPNVGQHLLVLAPLFAIGLARTIAGLGRSAWSRLLVAWLILYPVPAAICADWNPHPMRTVGGMLLFPILAACGGQWLMARLGGLGVWGRRMAVAIVAVAIGVNLAHVVNVYFREFPGLARPGYQAAMVEVMQFVAGRAEEADFILVTNYANQAYIYALLYHPIPPSEYARTEKVITAGRLGFHQVLQVGKYYFAPRDLPEATRRFQEAWRRLPPEAEGLVIDVRRPDRPAPGQVLRQIPVGALGLEGQVFEIYRWRLPPASAEGIQSVPPDYRASGE